MTSEVMAVRIASGEGRSTKPMTTHHALFGPMLRQHRVARRLSQEEMAHQAEVSTRHLSCLETGRASPSREMVLVLGSALDLPLRDRNTLLTAAGYAPVYSARSLDDAALEPVRRAIDHLLAAHEPFGAVVVDRDWNVLRLNAGAQRLLAWALEGLAPPPEALRNVVVATLHPGALRGRIVNLAEVAATLVDRARRELAVEADPARRAALAAWIAAATVDGHHAGAAPSAGPFIPLHLRKGDEELRLFTTLTTLGTPIDVTAQEVHIESYFPADDATERRLRAMR
jgi:transcriptional regulator with XRE-family HTH domain